jgi:hypothetical protein
MSDTFDSLARLAADGRLSRRQLAKRALAIAVASSFTPFVLRISGANAGVIGKIGDCPSQSAGSCPPNYKLSAYTPGCANKIPNGTTSTYNGCGPEAGIDLRKVFDHTGVPHFKFEPPDDPLWLGNFVNACINHDCCYGTCGASKTQCDNNFRSELHSVCQDTNSSSGVLDTALLFYCSAIAEQYYDAVANDPQGQAAFDSGQAEVCNCCVPACDGTCNPPCTGSATCDTKTCECVVPA